MTVGKEQVQNFEIQSGVAYKTAIDNNMAVVKEIGASFAASARIPPDMSVTVAPGRLFTNNVLLGFGTQTISFTAPVTNPRIDLIVIDQLTTVASRVAGTEAGSPVEPGIPVGKLPCCRIDLAVGMTQITNANIIDQRVGGGGSSSVTEVSQAVSVATSQTTNSLSRVHVKTNTTTAIVVRVTVVGVTGGTGGKNGSPASSATVNTDYTVTHNLGAIQMVTLAISVTSTAEPFTAALKIQYKQ